MGNLHARSRLDRSILEPEATATNLREIVEKTVSRSPNVARRCYLSPGNSAVVIGDPQLIKQIVTNLIQNIERYAPDGAVRIEFASDVSRLAATFADSGPGIPVYRSQQVFTDGGSAKGLGLGLSLSRQLARAMGGDLTIDNPGSPGGSFQVGVADLGHRTSRLRTGRDRARGSNQGLLAALTLADRPGGGAV